MPQGHGLACRDAWRWRGDHTGKDTSAGHLRGSSVMLPRAGVPICRSLSDASTASVGLRDTVATGCALSDSRQAPRAQTNRTELPPARINSITAAAASWSPISTRKFGYR